MMTRTMTISMILAAGLIGLGAAIASPADESGDVLLAAVAAAPSAPATQPSPRATGPTTQPQGSQISFLLTRNLPANLREAHLLARADLSPRDRQLVGFHAILRDSQKTIEQLVGQKKEFDRMPASQQARYREKAALIEEVLNTMSDTDRAKLLSLNPKERAKRITELAAQLKAKQIRDGSNPAGGNSPK